MHRITILLIGIFFAIGGCKTRPISVHDPQKPSNDLQSLASKRILLIMPMVYMDYTPGVYPDPLFPVATSPSALPDKSYVTRMQSHLGQHIKQIMKDIGIPIPFMPDKPSPFSLEQHKAFASVYIDHVAYFPLLRREVETVGADTVLVALLTARVPATIDYSESLSTVHLQITGIDVKSGEDCWHGEAYARERLENIDISDFVRLAIKNP